MNVKKHKLIKLPPRKRLVLTLDSHLLSYYQCCPRKFWLIFAEHLNPRKITQAYEVGTLIHEMLRRVDRAKLQKRRRFTDAQLMEIGFRTIRRSKALLNGSQRDSKEHRETVLFHISQFVNFYAWNKAQERFYQPVGYEVGFSKILYEDSDVLFIYEGRIDKIIKVVNPDDPRSGFLSWVDYKSQSRDYALYPNRNQFLGYSWALDTNIGFINYYGLQKEKKDPHKYKTVFHHPELINQWRAETIATYREILAKLSFGENEFKRNRYGCDSGKFGFCQFTALCDNAWTDSKITDGLTKINFEKREWKPW